jgi:hypothetical protein
MPATLPSGKIFWPFVPAAASRRSRGVGRRVAAVAQNFFEPRNVFQRVMPVRVAYLAVVDPPVTKLFLLGVASLTPTYAL